jgi:hypothetical protein
VLRLVELGTILKLGVQSSSSADQTVLTVYGLVKNVENVNCGALDAFNIDVCGTGG